MEIVTKSDATTILGLPVNEYKLGWTIGRYCGTAQRQMCRIHTHPFYTRINIHLCSSYHYINEVHCRIYSGGDALWGVDYRQWSLDSPAYGRSITDSHFSFNERYKKNGIISVTSPASPEFPFSRWENLVWTWINELGGYYLVSPEYALLGIEAIGGGRFNRQLVAVNSKGQIYFG